MRLRQGAACVSAILAATGLEGEPWPQDEDDSHVVLIQTVLDRAMRKDCLGNSTLCPRSLVIVYLLQKKWTKITIHKVDPSTHEVSRAIMFNDLICKSFTTQARARYKSISEI